jgi:dTDP-4-dehydrorhamnose reductase
VKWLVTGSNGMLGTDLVALLTSRDEDVTAAPRAELDVTDAEAVDRALAGYDVVVNAAGWTAVDAAEDHEDEARAANADAARHLARAARTHGARLVQISTDYVFDGSATDPYPEDAAAAPSSAYGRTKALGEEAVREELPDAHLVVRTAWLYGAHGSSFPTTIARLARERGQVDVVDDQVGQPTWTQDVADLVVRLVGVDAPAGTYHATSAGQCSWYDFARTVVVAAGLESSTVQPTTSASFVRPAPRPAYSVLGHEALVALGVEPIGDWEERWAEAAPSVLQQRL